MVRAAARRRTLPELGAETVVANFEADASHKRCCANMSLPPGTMVFDCHQKKSMASMDANHRTITQTDTAWRDFIHRENMARLNNSLGADFGSTRNRMKGTTTPVFTKQFTELIKTDQLYSTSNSRRSAAQASRRTQSASTSRGNKELEDRLARMEGQLESYKRDSRRLKKEFETLRMQSGR